MGTVVQIGNFTHQFCTEVHLAREMRSMGWVVIEFQEPQHPKDKRPFLRRLEEWCFENRPELVMYTRTWGLPGEAEVTWRRLEKFGVKTCSYHLDLYVGLDRQVQVGRDPFWLTEYVFSADGDPRSQTFFEQFFINHHWLSPAVVSDECTVGVYRDELAVDVAFVGSKNYHPEWSWRPEMIEFLEARYGERFRRFNNDTSGTVRGALLNDLFASAKVIVGDTLELKGHVNYWSDRYFETIGRGGFLVAPSVPGLEEFLVDGEHFIAYEHPRPGLSVGAALDGLGETIDFWLGHPVRREDIREAGQYHVRAHHTYRHRLREAFIVMGLIDDGPIARLELGSGYSPTPGFTHLDLNPAAPEVDIVGSAWPLEMADNMVGEIRAVDVLEHLSYWDTPKVLADWFRALAPGGKLFVQVPDAEMIMTWFVNDPHRLAERTPDGLPDTALAGAAWRLLGGHGDDVHVKGGQDFRLNAHYALFSPRSLRLALGQAGFEITSMTVNEHPNILCEAVKPSSYREPTVRNLAKKTEDLKIGLIARGEAARGLALLTRGFYENMPVAKVLLADLSRRGGTMAEGWYPEATRVLVKDGYSMDEAIAREWLEGLDVVYTAETSYDWRMPQWCRQAGVKLVIHGMPEFVRHGQPDSPDLEHPDEWWWPTTWRLDVLPKGVIVPVPMPDHHSIAAPADDSRLRIYHIAGKRAAGDRNGTNIFIEVMRSLDKNTAVTMFGLEGSLPEITRPRNLLPGNFTVNNEGVQDRWEMHNNQHLLVVPRRYAGLCLPALEAASRGMAVLMPDVPPNSELASVLVPAEPAKPMATPGGTIPTYRTQAKVLAEEINGLNIDRERLAAAMKHSYETCPRWSEYRSIYMEHLVRVCAT